MKVAKLKMKNKYLILVLVNFFSGLIEGGPPKLHVLKEWTFTISKNISDPSSLSKLIMTCSGDKQLKWSYKIPDYAYYSWKGGTVSFLSASETRQSTIGKEYFSTITVFEPTKSYTGYFTCFYYNEESRPSASTYVYLDDQGSGFVLDSASPHIIVRPPLGPIQINCRTTRPDIEVKVLVGEEEVPQNKYKFDPRMGVTFENVTDIPNYEQHEEIKCINKNSSNPSNLTFLLIKKPSIENPRNSHFVVGEDFTLKCLIHINKKYKPEFFWDFPNKTHAHTEIKIFGNEIYSASSLKIKKTRLSYAGRYRCEVSLGYKPAVAYKSIKIREYIDPFVQFLGKNDIKQRESFVNEGDNFKWENQFDGYPRNLNYTFSHYNKVILPLEDERVTTNYAYEEGILSLGIKRITAEDYGNYSVRLEAPNGSYDENYVFLTVNVTPKIGFSDIASLLPVNKNLSITAFITTNKIKPKINWWFYSDCPKGIGFCDEANGMLLSHSLENDPGPLNRYRSVTSLRPSTSGELVCKTINNIGISDTRIYLNVSDKPEAFLMTVRTENDLVNLTHREISKTIKVIEGDNINIECFALDFLFENVTFYPELKLYEEACDTKLSLGRCLTIMNIAIRDNLFIECVAQTRITSTIEKISLRINVVDKVAPQLLSNSTVSVNGNETTVKLPYPFYIACYVEGRPKTKITWLKDGVNIYKFLENKDYVFLRDNEQTLEFTFSTKEDEGIYECIAENRAGRIQPFTHVLIDGGVLTPLEICFVCLFIISCFVVIFLVIIFKKRRNIRMAKLNLLESKNVGNLSRKCTIGEQIELLPYDKTFEVKAENIRLGKLLGAGAFGRVLLAEVKGLEGRPSTRVAVKMCRDGGDKTHLRALILELKIMIHLGKHLNIVNLIGAHTSNIHQSELWLLVEYCKYGNLLKFIHRAKAQFINQINTVTDEINVHKISPFNNETLSGASLLNIADAPNLNFDGYIEEHSECSIKSGQSVMESRPPTASIAGSKEQNFTCWPDPVSGGENSEHPPASPLPGRRTSTPNSGSEFEFFMMLDSDMTLAPSPRPFSRTSSCASNSPEKPITSHSENIPGVSAPFTTNDIVCWAWQVANGMQYLTRRNVLHGDLAARNLLLADGNVVKICDFGLSRDMYQNDVYVKKSDDNIMPIKWMAPEAIQQKIFSIQSDVWSYGITLWEMFTLGDSPYSGVAINQEFLFALLKGMRLEKPKFCNEEIYSLLLDCWQLNPVKRPTFSRIVNILSDILSPERKQHYVNMNVVYKQKNEEWWSKNEDYLKLVLYPDFKNLHSPMREEGVIPNPRLERCVVDKDYLDMEKCIAEGNYFNLESNTTATPESQPTSFPPSTKSEGPNNEHESLAY